MGKSEFLFDLNLILPAPPNGGGGPLPNPVHGQDGCLPKRRGIKGAGRMGLVVFREQDGTIPAQAGQFIPDGFS